MAQVPTGTLFYVGSTIAAGKTITGITNASEAVVTATAHGYSNGDFVIIVSAWGRLNKRAFRVKGVATDTFTLEGMDTTSTTFFPNAPTGGAGTAYKVSAVTQVTQVLSASSSGGDPKSVTYKYIESEVENSINDGWSASSFQLDLDADSIGQAGYTALKSLTDVQTDTILKMVTKSGSIILVPCTVSLNEAVKLQDGQINRVSVAFNGNNRLTRYAS